ncbi:S-adenosyl-L-methionine-dependent methyltransferase [Pisolithus croceorrhizus]|nr:S-adenosyl-L-methionine-dependent methyltransferase [Pisolithus croceorrhizus]
MGNDGPGRWPSHPSNNGSQDDPEDGLSDASSALTQLGNEEFPRHFSEREGRLFHAHGGSPYPMPVDGGEQTRLNALHHILFERLNSHYGGPVRDVLAGEPGRHRRVLDLCTGTGTWVMDMASTFTNVRFSGIDIVPIVPRTTPRNIHFEIADATQPLRWPDGTMDFVHARNVSMAVADYRRTLSEAARVLRRGGLFFSGEILRKVTFDPNYFAGEPTVDAPRAENFYRIINRALAFRGLTNYAEEIAEYVYTSGQFGSVRRESYEIPIGEWSSSSSGRRLGARYRDNLAMFAWNFAPMLKDAGHSDSFIEEIIQGFVDDMGTVRGMVGVYQTVWARRC